MHSKVVKVTAIPFTLVISLQYKQALLWLVKCINQRREKDLTLKFFTELCSINFFNNSFALKKKLEWYRFAVLFKTATRFKW